MYILICGCSLKAHNLAGLLLPPATIHCCRSCPGIPVSVASDWLRCSIHWRNVHQMSRERNKSGDHLRRSLVQVQAPVRCTHLWGTQTSCVHRSLRSSTGMSCRLCRCVRTAGIGRFCAMNYARSLFLRGPRSPCSRSDLRDWCRRSL